MAGQAGRSHATGRLQAIIIAALMYWVLTIIFSYFQARLERRMAAETTDDRMTPRTSGRVDPFARSAR